MKNILIDFVGNNKKYFADAELDGISDSWTAHAKISLYLTITELHILFRLGNYLRPIFASEIDVMFFSPMFYEIKEKANEMLPKEYTEGFGVN